MFAIIFTIARMAGNQIIRNVMKLLNDERITREDGEIKLTIKPVTTSQQARLVDLEGDRSVAGRVARTHYCLKNCIEKLSINGEEFDTGKLVDHADLSDDDTLAVFIKIGVMASNASFPGVEDVKKSPQQPAPGA